MAPPDSQRGHRRRHDKEEDLMTDTNPAERLRAAADKLRTTLGELGRPGEAWSQHDTATGPYQMHIAFDGDPQWSGVADVILGSFAGPYIAAMNPLVGAAVAGWLEKTADDLFISSSLESPECPNCGEGCNGHPEVLFCERCGNGIEWTEHEPCTCWAAALAVADAILGAPVEVAS